MSSLNKPIVPGGDTVGTVGEIYHSDNGKTYECVAVIDNSTIKPNGEKVTKLEYVWVCTDEEAGGDGVTTLHINVTAVDDDTLKATFTADKTPSEMQQAATTGPIWCIVTFAAGIVNVDNPFSVGIPPAWDSFMPAFGYVVPALHDEDGTNNFMYVVRGGTDTTWLINLEAFGT